MAQQFPCANDGVAHDNFLTTLGCVSDRKLCASPHLMVLLPKSTTIAEPISRDAPSARRLRLQRPSASVCRCIRLLAWSFELGRIAKRSPRLGDRQSVLRARLCRLGGLMAGHLRVLE